MELPRERERGRERGRGGKEREREIIINKNIYTQILKIITVKGNGEKKNSII